MVRVTGQPPTQSVSGPGVEGEKWSRTHKTPERAWREQTLGQRKPPDVQRGVGKGIGSLGRLLSPGLPDSPPIIGPKGMVGDGFCHEEIALFIGNRRLPQCGKNHRKECDQKPVRVLQLRSTGNRGRGGKIPRAGRPRHTLWLGGPVRTVLVRSSPHRFQLPQIAPRPSRPVWL